MLQRLIDLVFAFECIDGDRCPYLHRWRLASFRSERRVYLHHFVGSDWSRDLHDHPKRFISIGLWGSYIEETPAPVELKLRNGQIVNEGMSRPRNHRTWRAPWVRSFPAAHIHRLILPPGGTCWTLVFTGRETQAWGFYLPDGTWIEWMRYMRGGRPDVAKDC